MVSLIKKVFAFDDLPYKGFNISVSRTKGFGLAESTGNSYIFAYPDVQSGSIRVSTTLGGLSDRVYYLDFNDSVEDKLRSVILGFIIEYTWMREKKEIKW
jgi:hypothetical protein